MPLRPPVPQTEPFFSGPASRRRQPPPPAAAALLLCAASFFLNTAFKQTLTHTALFGVGAPLKPRRRGRRRRLPTARQFRQLTVRVCKRVRVSECAIVVCVCKVLQVIQVKVTR